MLTQKSKNNAKQKHLQVALLLGHLSEKKQLLYKPPNNLSKHHISRCSAM